MISDKFQGQTPDCQNDMPENGAAGKVDDQGVNASSDDNVADAQVADSVKSTDESAEHSIDWKDKYMRLSAEFDNYRKRTLKEKMDLITLGGEDVIKALLPVLDDMDRALEVVSTASDVEAVRTGTELIIQKLRGILSGKGVSEIEALGAALDTDFHEAVAKIPAADPQHKGKIMDVVQKGYSLKDKVIRHAKVVVGE